MKYAILSALLGLATAAEEMMLPQEEEFPNFLDEIVPAEARVLVPVTTSFMQNQHELMAKGKMAAQLLGQRLLADGNPINQLPCQYLADGLRGYTFTPLAMADDFHTAAGFEANEVFAFSFCDHVPAAALKEKYSYCEAADTGRFGYTLDQDKQTCVAVTGAE